MNYQVKHIIFSLFLALLMVLNCSLCFAQNATLLPGLSNDSIEAPVVTCTLASQQNVIQPFEQEDSTLEEPRREFLSVKTNVLYDFAYVPGYDRFCPIPNVSFEYYPLHGHFTFGGNFDCPWWQHYDIYKYFQIRNYQLHSRYYFRSGDIRKRQPGKGAAFKGPYISAYVHAGLYNICFGEKRGWEGEGWGVGLGAGWVIPLDKKQHWRLELGAQFGYFQTRYDPYQWLCPIQPEVDPEQYYYKWYGKAEDFVTRQYRYTWLGPSRVEVTLSYDLLYRRIHKRGVSFRSKERNRR